MFSVLNQTVHVITPGDDRVCTVSFRDDGDDVSKSIMEITDRNGYRSVLTFHTNGMLIEQQWIETDGPYGELSPASELGEPEVPPMPPPNTETADGEEVQGDADHEAGPGKEKQPA